jgi:hypothetical protein
MRVVPGLSIVLPLALTPALAAGGTAELRFEKAVDFYFETDIAQIHAYDGLSLGTIDLFAPGETAPSTVRLPGIDARHHVTHLSTTPYVLVTSADARLLAGEAAGERVKSSYLVNTLTGRLVWEHEPLPPAGEVYAFPHSGTAILRHGRKLDEFTAIDFRTGERLWDQEIDSRAVWTDGPRLEIVGGETCTIDARSGAKLRSTALPIKKRTSAVADPETRRFVFAKGDNLVGYSLPPVDAPANGPLRLWETTGVKVNDPCVDMGYCTVELLGGGRLYQSNWVEGLLLDSGTGETVWTHKRKRSAAPGLPVSRAGTYGAYALNKELSVIDIASGKTVRTIPIEEHEGKAVHSEIIWIDDTDGLVVYQDVKKRPKSVVRFAATSAEPKWSAELLEPADFKATAAEKGKLIGRIFGAIALSAVSMANPIATSGGYSYHLVFYPSWRVRTNQRIDPASVAGLEGSVTDDERNALQRFRRRAEMVNRTGEADLLFVTGKGEEFKFYTLSLGDGSTQTIATHRGPHVHAIEPDVEYCLAVALEDQKRLFKVVELKGCRGDRRTALPVQRRENAPNLR